MFNVIYTYQSVLPESEGESRRIDLGQFESEDAARDYILDQFDQVIEKMDDDDEAWMPTKHLSEHFAESYSVEASV